MTTENPTLLNISETAKDKFKEILEEEGTPNAFLRITLAPGGHGGAQYILGLEEKADEDDTVVDSGAVKVLVSSDSLGLIDGTSIDYIDNMERSGFVISNPNLPATGGCGGGGGGCGCGGGGGGCGCGGGSDGHGETSERAGCACGGGGGGGCGGGSDGHGETSERAGCACGGH